MISFTRVVLVALVACAGLCWTEKISAQLRPGDEQLPSTQSSPAAPGNAPATGSDAATGDHSPGAPASPRVSTSPQAAPVPPAAGDNGEADRQAEQLIQQELQSRSQEEEAGPPRPATNVPLGRDEVLIRADQQEKNQDIYNVRGHVQIRFRDYVLHADQATYDSTTGEVTANGNVVLEGGLHNEHIVATHGVYNVSRDTGKFYDVTGSTGVRVKNNKMFLSSSTPFFFTGKVVEKLGPDRYRVNHGYITSCQLPKPKWVFDARTAEVEVGEEAKMYHSTLRIKGVPVFYFPYAQHPVENLGRKSGFLLPEIGQSTIRGFIFGDGFYWAINRSSDLTIGASLYSSIGSAQEANYRSIGYNYRFQAQYFGVIDSSGPPVIGQNPGGHEIKADGDWKLPAGFRGVISADILSSYLFRVRFAMSYIEAILSEVRSSGFLTKNWNGYGFGLVVARYQNYESFAPGDYIDIAHTPSFEFSSVERPFSRSRLVYGYDAAAEGVSRHEIGFETAPVVGRLDAAPYVALPAYFHGWTFRPQAGFRETYYSQRLVPRATGIIGTASSNALNRNVFTGSVEVRPPAFSRIFDHKLFGNVVKHTVEPFAVYSYQSGIENFSNILRFDQRDILADTNEVEYGLVNRVFAKKSKSTSSCFHHPKYALLSENSPASADHKGDAGTCDDESGPAREVITWELAQKYFLDPTFGGALLPESRNVFDSAVDFTGIAFLAEARRWSPIISRLRIQDNATDFQWAVDYDPQLHQFNSSTIFAGRHLGPWYLSGGQTYMRLPAELGTNALQLPAETVNQYRIMLQYGGITRRGLSAAFNVGLDSQLSYVQGSSLQANYNWDCCGVAFLYSRWAPGAGLATENAYRFSFSLSNVGTFGNIKRLQRLY